MSLIDKLKKISIGVGLGLASLLSNSTNASTINVSTQLPLTDLIADGSTIYQMNVRVDSTKFPTTKILSSIWKVRIPTNTTFVDATLPDGTNNSSGPSVNLNDFFYPQSENGFGGFMDALNNRVDNSVDGGRLTDNVRSVEIFVEGVNGPMNRIGELGHYFFNVNVTAPIGYVEGLFIDINNTGSNPNNFGLFGVDIRDTNNTSYTITNENLSISISPFYIRALGDVNFDGVIDENDIDEEVYSALNPGSADLYRHDLTRDGIVNEIDFKHLINNIIGTMEGDANLDRSVDANDLAFVRTNFGQQGGWAYGNFTIEDYNVDANDLALVRTNFGFSGNGSYVNNVKPEPSSVGLLGLLGMASFGASAFGRRRLNARGQLNGYDQGMAYGGRDIDKEVYLEKNLENRVV